MRYSFTKRNHGSVFGRLVGLNWTELTAEIDKWEAGAKGYLTVQKEGVPKSRSQLAYYYAVILPIGLKSMAENDEVCLEFRIRDKMAKLPLTIDTLDLFFKTRYADYRGVYVDKREMDKARCSDFMDFAIKWLYRWLDCVVPPPDLNWIE